MRRTAAERVAAKRAEVLGGALAGLSGADPAALGRTHARPEAVRGMCCLCDAGCAVAPKGGCPVSNAVCARYPS